MIHLALREAGCLNSPRNNCAIERLAPRGFAALEAATYSFGVSDVVAHYTRVGDAPRVGMGGRFVAMLIAATCLAVLIVATRLSPSPDGMGTHRALGFPGCQFLEHTGLPCPSCGMTTSFSWFVRGNVMASFSLRDRHLGRFKPIFIYNYLRNKNKQKIRSRESMDQ